MEYTTEVLDRQTGELVTQSLGEWKTVSEIATDYGLGPNEFRYALTTMGLLSPEGVRGRRRLVPDAVRDGLGKRIDPGKHSSHKFPFDTISPKGQRYIADHWDETIAKVRAEKGAPVAEAQAALEAFTSRRTSQMDVQMKVCWLLDHFPDITHANLAKVISSSRQLVDHYARLRTKQRSKAPRSNLPEVGA